LYYYDTTITKPPTDWWATINDTCCPRQPTLSAQDTN